MPCKSDGFSLTSGDFPTLGSEKECVGKDAESQGSMFLCYLYSIYFTIEVVYLVFVNLFLGCIFHYYQ